MILVNLFAGDPMPDPSAPKIDPSVVEGTRAIIERVRAQGDAALVELTQRHDGADLSSGIEVPRQLWEVAAERVPPAVRSALSEMAARLRALHARQLPRPWSDQASGVAFSEVVRPLAVVGCYVPGGRAAYPSTVLMTAVPARVAGVGRVVLCTPPRADGSVPDAVLYAALVSDADAVYRVGGAHAVAALAYGTETVPRVDKVVGPGNVWVTAAKREVSGIVGIDGLAGPTELVIVADQTADPSLLAVDLVAQAEHDPRAMTTVVTLDPGLAEALDVAARAEAERSPRREIVARSMAATRMVLAPDRTTAAKVVDRLAPEHLQVVVADPGSFLDAVRSFGAAFLGPSTPVSFGDYGVGSNHVLPTMGTARFASGLRAADFVTVSSFVGASEEGLRTFGPQVEAVAGAEGLPGHARASEVRRTGGTS